jgi:hypothetical protein
MMRRSCRKADKVVSVTSSPLDGLSYLALMPNTSENGRRAGERWLRACVRATLYPRQPSLIGELQIQYSFVLTNVNTSAQEALQSLLDESNSSNVETR